MCSTVVHVVHASLLGAWWNESFFFLALLYRTTGWNFQLHCGCSVPALGLCRSVGFPSGELLGRLSAGRLG